MRLIEGQERDKLILDILKRISSDTQVIASPERTSVWEKGWNEQLRSGGVIPKFIRNGPIRFYQQFYEPDACINELRFIEHTQYQLAQYLSGCKNIHEFGCGTGINLHALAKHLPDAKLHGYDFSESACAMTAKVAHTQYFDMMKPSKMKISGGVFTFGAVEQLGEGFRPFIDYLIQQKPKIVVHIEPVPELLDERNLVDYLSLLFQRKRGYTHGLLDYLKKKVEVIEVERSWFGSTMIESYARIVWKP